MFRVPRKDPLPTLIKVSNALGGHLRYDSSQGGGFVRIGEPPYHVDIRKGDSIVTKGGQAIVTRYYIKQKIAYLKKHPELKHMVGGMEQILKKAVQIER